ncbi:hypothetical protein PYW07_006515 [Mythimna separata]|uniref:Peptidase M14 domain-containing protein n=1 Tax=Mythimna separata TaxID=271217 RepID=A0AAD7YVZ1_MYTSE|nr:hypothetical protein PYW07_006515 [Mythimna separata]
MILLNFFLFLFLKVIGAETEHKTVHLWRAQGDFNDTVLNKFYERASQGEDIWIRENGTIDFLLYNEEQDQIAAYLKEHGLNQTVLIHDVRGKLDEALVKTFPTKRNAVTGDSFTWTAYPSLHEINEYLIKMAATYPTHCKISTIGKTAHFKPIHMLKITNGASNNKAILVDSGTHGREWTSVISTLYFIDSIVPKFYQQPAYVTTKDWYIIPVLNPDGYDYSLTTDRLWRKNRRRLSGMCYGIDLNRNFAYGWAKEESTQNVCSSNYCGPVPFSEEETKAFKRVVDGKHFIGYLSIHSAGTKVLYPRGADHDDHHKHLFMTKEIALAMRKIGGLQFLNRDIEKMGKIRYGMAIDWMFFVKQVQHSYILETRGHNGLDYIPPEQILPAAKEVTAGLMKFAEKFR